MTTKKELHKCGVGDCAYEHASPASVGVHRRFAHGVKGQKTELAVVKVKKVKKEKEQEKGTNLIHEIPETLIAHTLGRIEEIFLNTALQHDLPPKLFAQRCAEYFSGKKVR